MNSKTHALEKNYDTFFQGTDLAGENCLQSLRDAMSSTTDDGDLYFQATTAESWVLEDGKVKDTSYHADSGVGVRLIAGEETGFAYTSDLSLATLNKSLKAAAQVARTHHGSGEAISIDAASKSLRHLTKIPAQYAPINPIESWTAAEKKACLEQCENIARKADARVKQVTVSLSGQNEHIMVLRADGLLAADIRPMIRLNVSVLVVEGDKREKGSAGAGGRYDYAELLAQNYPEKLVKEAVHQAVTNLDAMPCPAGEMPVVLGSGWPGVLLHEAVGHGLEGDFIRKGSSIFTGRVGEPVASKACTVVDHGAIADRRGSLTIDDEGTPTQENVLIENGILRGFMYDRHNAKLMNTPPTGNGRRESYGHLPMPRMTNTYMLNGEHTPEEVIGSVKKGIYASQFAGGQVDITSGNFVFAASLAYLIEDGKITAPVKGATLIGNGPDVMHKISMVANDLKLDEGVGVCGKAGQSVPVGVGQPTLKIDAVTVGGTAND